MRHLKLQQPPRPRTRVRDLARDLDLVDTELLAWLREHGEWVPHVLSFLEEPVAAKARAAFRPDMANAAVPVTASDPGSATAGSSAAAPVPSRPLTGLTPPQAPPARENNPFLGQLKKFRPRPSRQAASAAPEPLKTSGSTPSPDYSAAGAFPASEAMAPFEWALRGVEDRKQEWLDHGLGPRDARIAEACQAAALVPSDLGVSIAGWTVLDRITRGEPPHQVARLLRRQREQTRDSG